MAKYAHEWTHCSLYQRKLWMMVDGKAKLVSCCAANLLIENGNARGGRGSEASCPSPRTPAFAS